MNGNIPLCYILALYFGILIFDFYFRLWFRLRLWLRLSLWLWLWLWLRLYFNAILYRCISTLNKDNLAFKSVLNLLIEMLDGLNRPLHRLIFLLNLSYLAWKLHLFVLHYRIWLFEYIESTCILPFLAELNLIGVLLLIYNTNLLIYVGQ